MTQNLKAADVRALREDLEAEGWPVNLVALTKAVRHVESEVARRRGLEPAGYLLHWPDEAAEADTKELADPLLQVYSTDYHHLVTFYGHPDIEQFGWQT